eukprot:273082-Rhodomonas_salina.1
MAPPARQTRDHHDAVTGIDLESMIMGPTLAKSCDPSRDCSRSRARCRHSGVQTMPKVVASVVPGC